MRALARSISGVPEVKRAGVKQDRFGNEHARDGKSPTLFPQIINAVRHAISRRRPIALPASPPQTAGCVQERSLEMSAAAPTSSS